MKKTMKKAIVFLLAVLVLTSATAVGASACAMIYVGAALTEDGAAIVARSEDLGGSIDKLFFRQEAGLFKKGEVFEGCSGFRWTFTHDSYAYTAFRDDNGDGVDGVCPDCGSTAEKHLPYEEAGTNEKGVTVTATETLFPNAAFGAVDPLVYDGGIAESEMTTILLGECATAREAVELLLGVYDTYGTGEANGLLIADSDEVWYIENLSGHHYIALLLPDDLVFIEMNISVIGAIDLDDAEHVIASDGLIEAAVAAGTFVGDAEEHIIDFRNSCSDAVDYPGYGERTINGLNFLNGTDAFTETNTTDADLVLSNVDENGALVPLYTNISLTRPYGIEDVIDFYKVSPIGRPANQETNIFQIWPGAADAALGTVEWVSMGNDRYTVFVPHFPMLITDTYEGYQVSTAAAGFASDEPDAGADWYPDSQMVFLWDGESLEIEESEGYCVLPENWRDSVYWAFDAVAELITSGAVSAEDEALVVESYADLQQDICTAFTGQRLAMHDTQPADRPALATEDSAAMALNAHRTALGLYDTLTGSADTASGEASGLPS